LGSRTLKSFCAWSVKSVWIHEFWRIRFVLGSDLDGPKQFNEGWMRFVEIPRSRSISVIITNTIQSKHNLDWFCSWLCLLQELSDEMRL
jgi:hypothetical protein